jgi:hypothetical protein
LLQCKEMTAAHLQIEAELPSESLVLQWSELANPLTFAKVDFATELIGAKLSAYKFHYVGSFQYAERAVNGAGENFSATLSGKSIHNHQFESAGACNCSWLLELLINAEKGIVVDNLRWYAVENGFALTLSRKTDRFSESQHFVFSKNFSSLSWSQEMKFI